MKEKEKSPLNLMTKYHGLVNTSHFHDDDDELGHNVPKVHWESDKILSNECREKN